MLGPAISQIRQKVGIFQAQCSVVVSTLKLRCKTIIAAGIDRVILIAQFIKSQCVALKSNIELCLAQLTNQVLSMKLGLMIVQHNLGVRGQQLLTTVRQILQRVYQALKRGR
jgi:hypothetical protein